MQWRIDAWSLDALGVPIYPQDRFQLGVAEAAIASQHLGGDFRIVMQSTADRRTGERDEQTISSSRTDAAQSKFFWNAHPPLITCPMRRETPRCVGRSAPALNS